MTKIFIPAGKISAKKREFKSIVADVRHAVFSVVRQRPVANGQFLIHALGPGFFVSSSVFITCWHVIDDLGTPHQAGDQYVLMNNLDGNNGISYLITGGVGKGIHLFPHLDFAIILCDIKADQAFLPISYEPPRVGSELGVAGYPLASISANANGSADIKGLVYRVAKGVATAVYNTNLDSGDGQPLTDVKVVI